MARLVTRRIRSAAVLPPVIHPPHRLAMGWGWPRRGRGGPPRTNWALARHIIAHELRPTDGLIFAAALIAPLAALAVLL